MHPNRLVGQGGYHTCEQRAIQHPRATSHRPVIVKTVAYSMFYPATLPQEDSSRLPSVHASLASRSVEGSSTVNRTAVLSGVGEGASDPSRDSPGFSLDFFELDLRMAGNESRPGPDCTAVRDLARCVLSAPGPAALGTGKPSAHSAVPAAEPREPQLTVPTVSASSSCGLNTAA